MRIAGRSHELRALRRRAAAYWATGLVSPGSIQVDWSAWIALGGAAAITATRAPEGGWTSPLLGTAPWLPFAAAALGLAIAYGPFVANEEAGAASASGKDPAAATRHAEAAVARDSGRARYWQELGAARAAGGAVARGRGRVHRGDAPRALRRGLLGNLATAQAGRAVAGDDPAAARAAAFDARAPLRRGVRCAPVT